jgi:hypothetical protein
MCSIMQSARDAVQLTGEDLVLHPLLHMDVLTPVLLMASVEEPIGQAQQNVHIHAGGV